MALLLHFVDADKKLTLGSMGYPFHHLYELVKFWDVKVNLLLVD